MGLIRTYVFLSTLLLYPLPAWKIADLAVKKLPRMKQFQFQYRGQLCNGTDCTTPVPCVFRVKDNRAVLRCESFKEVYTVPREKGEFPQPLTLVHFQNCISLATAYLAELARVKKYEQLTAFMMSAGIDTEASGVTRWGNDIAVTVGAESEDSSVSQMWFHQEEHVPLLFRTQLSSSLKCEVRTSRYVRAGRRGLFPSDVAVYSNGTLVLHLKQ